MLLTPGSPPHRVPRHMDDRQDADFMSGRDVEDSKREMTQRRASDRTTDHGITGRITADACKGGGEFLQKPPPKARLLRFVPVPGLCQVVLGLGPNTGRQDHYSGSSRSRTSAQGDPADGSDS